ncbi:MAG: xylose isomerase [Defluviitaleaceae bacterium]|nr:xylose isomerase [Defluviitaleaceae bacterium]
MKYFPSIQHIKYEGKDSNNMFAFRHYNPDEIVNGKPMKENLRFAVAYWHTLVNDGSDPFGGSVNNRDWIHNDPMETAKNRVYANFELLEKLGIEYFCFHDLDIAPTGESLLEFHKNIDEITDLIQLEMKRTGIKVLWNTANMFTQKHYINGAGTSPNADVFAIAAAQVKKGLDICKKLNAKNYVFWGGREGYETLLNTDMELELNNLARLYKMAISYAKEIGHEVQFLIEPKPKEPSKHQYDFDATTTLAFLYKYGLEKDFKLNLEANHATLAGHTFEHELRVSRLNGVLGSIDANQGDLLLGWDTDEFPTDLMSSILAMYEIVENGGLGTGGINFDSKVRRSSFEMEDLFLAHIAGMDTLARAYKIAVKLKEDGFFDNIIKERYESYNTGIGKDIVSGNCDLKSLSEYALKLKNNDIKNPSSHIEYVKSKLNDYL